MRKFSIVGLLVALASMVAIGAAPAAAQSYLQREFFASDFAQWRVPSQQANTFQWSPGSICAASAAGINFQPFATNAPVLIQDVTATNSEVVTPSVVTVTGTQCSVTVTPLNQHFSFSISSGTGGLQEALNQISSSNVYPVAIVLDRNWYSLAASVPKTTPATIIAAAKGSASAYLLDKTTVPATSYAWNGTAYVATGADASNGNLAVSSFTQISAPTALTTATAANGMITTAATGGTVAAATYRLAATYVDASGGETLISTDSASTATIATSGTTSTISVTSPAAATGAVGWRLYMTAASGASGAEILYSPSCSLTTPVVQGVFVPATVCPIGATATITAVVTGTATVPSISSAWPRTGAQSGSYPPFAALGTVASAATGTLGVVNFPAGYFNTLGRSLMICGNGFATTNGTGGTITLKNAFFSVPGVTSITPFSVASAAIGASAIQVPINFCVTYTTAATGATGTLEVHGVVNYGLAGTAVDSPANDIIFAVSSTVDLTKQDQIAVTITPTTAGLTAAQLRQLNVYPSY